MDGEGDRRSQSQYVGGNMFLDDLRAVSTGRRVPYMHRLDIENRVGDYGELNEYLMKVELAIKFTVPLNSSGHSHEVFRRACDNARRLMAQHIYNDVLKALAEIRCHLYEAETVRRVCENLEQAIVRDHTQANV